jgi:uncharacterized Zn finger protein
MGRIKMEWIEIACPLCGKNVKIKKTAMCGNCGLIIVLNQEEIPLGLADAVNIICRKE